jgi:hypothetical protein
MQGLNEQNTPSPRRHAAADATACGASGALRGHASLVGVRRSRWMHLN